MGKGKGRCLSLWVFGQVCVEYLNHVIISSATKPEKRVRETFGVRWCVWCLVVWAKLKLVACSWLSPFSANNKNTNKIGLHIFLKLYIPTHTERNKKHSCFVTQFNSGKICIFRLRFLFSAVFALLSSRPPKK